MYNLYLEQYPDDKALMFSLKSIEHRRSLLLEEMELMLAIGGHRGIDSSDFVLNPRRTP